MVSKTMLRSIFAGVMSSIRKAKVMNCDVRVEHDTNQSCLDWVSVQRFYSGYRTITITIKVYEKRKGD
jgi:hypothetical protein